MRNLKTAPDRHLKCAFQMTHRDVIWCTHGPKYCLSNFNSKCAFQIKLKWVSVNFEVFVGRLNDACFQTRFKKRSSVWPLTWVEMTRLHMYVSAEISVHEKCGSFSGQKRFRGGSRIFIFFFWGGGGGAHRLYGYPHITSTKPEIPTAWVKGPLKGPGSCQGFLMLYRAIWTLVLSILIQNGI